MVCTSLFQVPYSDWFYSIDSTNQYLYDWTFEPNVDGSVRVKAEITLGESLSSYVIEFFREYPMNVMARDAESGEKITFVEQEEEDRKIIIFEFDNEEEKGFKFLVEFDLIDKIEKIEGVYVLYWEWIRDHSIIHTATVILPQGYEMLSTEYVTPKEVSLDQGQEFVKLEKKVSESELFQFEVIFSETDSDGDGYLRSQDCDDNDAAVYPGADEVCDGKDNDCDGRIDEVDLLVKIVDRNENPVEGALVEIMENEALIAKGSTFAKGKVKFTILANKEYTIRVSKGEISIEENFSVECRSEPVTLIITFDACEDADTDGYSSAECGGTDYNDDNPAVYPGADEVYDQEDNDGDGRIDEEDEDYVEKAKIWIDKGSKSTYSDGDDVVASFIVYSRAPTARITIQKQCGDTIEIIFDEDVSTMEVHQTDPFKVQCPADKGRLTIVLNLEAKIVVEEAEEILTDTCEFYVYHIEPALSDENSVDIWVDRDCNSMYNDGDDIVVSFIVYSLASTARVTIQKQCGGTTEYIIEEEEVGTNTVHNKKLTVTCLADQARLDIQAMVKVEDIETRIPVRSCIFNVCYDRDSDGAPTCVDCDRESACAECGGAIICVDCDDNNPAIHPGAEEICDGKDNNCNKEIDEVEVILNIVVVDQFGYPVIEAEVIVKAEGFSELKYPTDENGKVQFKVPGNREYTIIVTTKAKDAEKSETYEVGCVPPPGAFEKIITMKVLEDKDKDGHISEIYGGDDCNDNDENVHPGAEEICCDGVDNNCNGKRNEGCPTLAKIWIESDENCALEYRFGNTIRAHFIVCSDVSRARVSITKCCGEKSELLISKEFPTNEIHTIPVLILVDCTASQMTLRIEARIEGIDKLENECTFSVCFDNDNDGCTTCEGDCDDSKDTVYLGAEENWADLIDNNCDKVIPEALVLLVILGGTILVLVKLKAKYKQKLFRRHENE